MAHQKQDLLLSQVELKQLMDHIYMITFKSVWLSLKGRLWRVWYRLKSRVRRAIEKQNRQVSKRQNRPRLYRIEIR